MGSVTFSYDTLSDDSVNIRCNCLAILLLPAGTLPKAGQFYIQGTFTNILFLSKPGRSQGLLYKLNGVGPVDTRPSIAEAPPIGKIYILVKSTCYVYSTELFHMELFHTHQELRLSS